MGEKWVCSGTTDVGTLAEVENTHVLLLHVTGNSELIHVFVCPKVGTLAAVEENVYILVHDKGDLAESVEK